MRIPRKLFKINNCRSCFSRRHERELRIMFSVVYLNYNNASDILQQNNVAFGLKATLLQREINIHKHVRSKFICYKDHRM